uniref:Uncharacterized protein n=1 Tax=Anguilla anguilla TaxID=7936 RepID=A0A0E9WKE1_ANGAN
MFHTQINQNSSCKNIYNFLIMYFDMNRALKFMLSYTWFRQEFNKH